MTPTLARTVQSLAAEKIGSQLAEQDWYRVGVHYGSLLGPEHDIRMTATGKLFRVGDFTYTRLLKHGAEPTPEEWLEISEDGEPAEYPEEDRACSDADRRYQMRQE